MTLPSAPPASHPPAVPPWRPHAPALRALLDAFLREISPVYLVGGVVRDHLLGLPAALNDLDLVVPHSAIPVARRVADRLGWAFYPLDEARDVARLIFTSAGPPVVCDVAAMRGGSIAADLRTRDFTVNALAIAWDGRSPATVLDATGGIADLRSGVLRQVTATSLPDDPVRLLRAARFMAQLRFRLDDATRDQILRMPSALLLTGAERVRDELWKLLAAPAPDRALEELRLLGVLPYALPEVADMVGVEQSAPHAYDVYVHTLAAVRFAADLRDWLLSARAVPPPAPGVFTGMLPTDAPERAAGDAEAMRLLQERLAPWAYALRRHVAPAVAAGHSRAQWLVWYALYHDAGKPDSRTVEQEPGGAGVRYRFLGHEERSAALAQRRLERLRFSRLEIELAAAVLRGHMRPHHLDDAFAGQPISRRAAYRFFRDVGGRETDQPAGVDTLLLALADLRATHHTAPPPDWSSYLTHVAQLLNFVYSERGLEQARLRPLIDGHTLMRRFQLPPGPRIGALLDQLAEAQAAGEIATPDEAIQYAEKLVESD